MSNVEIQQVFQVGDKTFSTKADAQAYIRRPKILEAFNQIEGMNESLSTWLLDNQELLETAFECGTIRRVTKVEAKKLAKALDRVVEINDPATSFIIENHVAIKDSFRWPSVKRLNDEEKVAAAKVILSESVEDEALVDWLLDNRTVLEEAYKAGIEKRPVASAATEGLARYRAEQAEKKRLAEEAKAAVAEE